MAFGSGIAGIYAGWLADRFGCKRPILAILIDYKLSRPIKPYQHLQVLI